jgi:HTH-type transcriptional regulator/antitoxin HigA
MSMTTSYPFRPDYAIPPGETLRDRLVEMSLSQSELATRLGLSAKHVNQIIQGIAPITLETAILLERVTGVPASTWNRRESDYREALLRARSHQLSSDDEKWLATLPIKELQKRNRLAKETDRGRLFDAVLSFFGVADREAWEQIWRGPVASFRRSQAYRSDPGAVVSWLRLAQTDAQQAQVQPYSAARFRAVLNDVRRLTAEDDANVIVDMCAEAGVVVVFVPEIQNCRISGATFWAGPNRAVIALSDRYKKDDRFWFSFFHEAAHVLLHSKKETFVDDGSEDDNVEREADKFAADYLIPPAHARRLPSLATQEDVTAFAEELGIAPGIVVGRLQHEELWGWSQGNKLKRSLWIVDD